MLRPRRRDAGRTTDGRGGKTGSGRQAWYLSRIPRQAHLPLCFDWSRTALPMRQGQPYRKASFLCRHWPSTHDTQDRFLTEPRRMSVLSVHPRDLITAAQNDHLSDPLMSRRLTPMTTRGTVGQVPRTTIPQDRPGSLDAMPAVLLGGPHCTHEAGAPELASISPFGLAPSQRLPLHIYDQTSCLYSFLCTFICVNISFLNTRLLPLRCVSTGPALGSDSSIACD